jgi:hypothetical protein
LINQKSVSSGKCWWLTPTILATQEAEIKRIMVQSQLRQIALKKGLVVWFEVWALSSNPNTAKKNKVPL